MTRTATPKKSAKPTRTKGKAPAKTAAAKRAAPKLLSGGNPQIAMADGDEAVQRYIAAMPDWRQDLGRRLDRLITATVPGVRKAVKWNSPFYGVAGQGWFASFHTYDKFVKLTFFMGTSLRPVPSGGKAQAARWVNLDQGHFDEGQVTAWIRQAAAIPGWLAGSA